ncbi:MAG: thioredoxin-dependent thiol peroxidase [Bacteroidales bacterium]
MTTLKRGDTAPGFTAFDQHKNRISLGDFRGNKVILYFYPKDDTPGCTAEACNLRDNEAKLMEKGFQVIGVSADDEASHKKFSEKFDLAFPLIPDVDKEIINAYGVWGPKKFMGKTYSGINRTTFVIDEAGKIDRIFEKVRTGEHAEQILREYA